MVGGVTDPGYKRRVRESKKRPATVEPIDCGDRLELDILSDFGRDCKQPVTTSGKN